jgi:hypothetical protein
MFLGLLTLLTALVISSVAVYYSVSGLAAIFAGAYIPIIIMGASLEIGKLVTASWLHVNWRKAPIVLKTYLSIATLILMLITSMGIFGFLSRAHVEQGAPVGDVSAQIELIDEKINAKRGEIDQARTAIKNLDDVVAQYMLKGKDEKSVAAANNARKNQQTERNKTTKVIEDAQKEISKLQELKLPLTKAVRKIETEVGPIKYLAAFIYGNNPNQDLLEKAVTWMILIIIFVFDPLAVLLLIAGQMSMMQSAAARKAKKEAKEAANVPVPIPVPEPIRTVEVVNTPVVPEPIIFVEPVVLPVETVKQDANDVPSVLILQGEHSQPQRKKKEAPPVELPTPIIEEVKKKDEVVYVQNSEQGESTLWQRVQRSRNIFKPMDVLYSEYSEHGFRDIDLSTQDQTDLEIQILTKYVDDIKNNLIKFDDIPIEHREKLAELITRE